MAMDTGLHSRWLPHGRFELTLGRCVPVIVRAGTFFSKTRSELYCLVGMLTLVADFFRKQHGYELPLETGTFTEGETEFVLEDPDGSSQFCKLRVPRTIAFQEPE